MKRAVSQFKTQLQEVSAWALGKKIAHNYMGGAGLFENLTYEQQVLAATGLRRYFEFLQEADQESLDYADTVLLLRRALEKLELQLDPGLLEKVQPRDFVEIYTPDWVPAFKSLNFWGNSSYTLDELYSYPYEQLFAREEFFQAAINRSGNKVMAGKERVIFNPVPEHVAWELRGPMRRIIAYKFFAGVYDQAGVLAGMIVVCDIKPLSN